ncbi:MAG: TRAP transporter large permease [Clostridium sp.]|jgi:C4-dicarboxylate transporter DctM subunit|nr:TRAP transporter large permease [Clostridium sp.]
MIATLFLGILFFFLIGTPIAVGLGLGTTISIILDGNFPLVLVPQRMFTGLDSWPIMAIPLFMFAGNLMDEGGLSQKIVEFAEAWVGWLKGSLAMVCVLASMVFAGISGSSTADTAAVGAILMPAMREKGYDMRFASVLQAGAGAIGPIIPPSILMVLIGYSTNTSVGQLFMCGVIPGILVGASLMVYSYIHASHRGDAYVSTAPFDLKTAMKKTWIALPGIGLPFIIIFGIVGGIFTATEGAGIAVLYGLIVALFVYKEITVKDLPRLLLKSAESASMIIIITAAAYIFSWFITAKQIPQLLVTFMNTYIHSRFLFLIFLNIVLFIIGMFMESFTAIIVLMPILFPVATSFGISPLHFGTIVCVNLAIGYVTPPYGATLFVSCGLTGKSIKEVVPFCFPVIAAMLVALIIVTYCPGLYMWLPNLVK